MYKYILTPHANRFIDFLGKKLFNEHTHFPLRKTFQNYGLFNAESITTVKEFEAWYEYNFKNSSKSNIEDHLEAFKDLVNNSILRLNELTTINDNLAIENLEEFVGIFKQITARAGEIRETLHLSGTLKSEIRKVVDRFQKLTLERPNKQDEQEQIKLKELKTEYEMASSIRNEVFTFFDLIEDKLEQIVERYLYADKQLSYYKENFRTRSKFQLDLRNFLKYTLKNSKFDKVHGVSFGIQFPTKSYPQERFKFIHPKYYESFKQKENIIISNEKDELYELEQLTLTNSKLLKQEKVAKLVQEYKNLLSIHKSLDVTKCFYEILNETEDSDISLQVIHAIIQFTSTKEDYIIKINEKLDEEQLKNEILLWKMSIKQKQ